MNDLIERIDKLLIQTHNNYPVDNIRMTEKFWLFRYFFYYLQVKGIIFKKDINSYCKKVRYKSGNKGYETELNWKYIRNNPHSNNIDCFFDELLENKIWLVYCGENDDFAYLPKK